MDIHRESPQPAPAPAPEPAPDLRPVDTAPDRLLTRIGRHTLLRPGRLVIALLLRNRQYVAGAGWTSSVDLDRRSSQPPSGGTAQELHLRVHRTLDGLDLPPLARRSAYAVAVVRCRAGRVVWLPTDLAWVETAAELAEGSSLPIAGSYLVTEHGWRRLETDTDARHGEGGPAPTLAA